MNQKGKATLKLVAEKLKYRRYADSTQKMYYSYIKQFVLITPKSTAHLTSDDMNEYLMSYPYTSGSQQNQVISALKFLYRDVLGKRYRLVDFKRPRKTRRLPKVVDPDMLTDKIIQIKNLKHKTILSLTYSTAMRISEVLSLRPQDIDSSLMLIHIKNAKFNKSRSVKLTPYILELLREYWKQYRPTTFVFEGKPGQKYSYSSSLKIAKKYIGVTTHPLRHTSATYMVEAGDNLRLIQHKLGHSSSKTTEIYTHVSRKALHAASSPM